MSAQIKVQLAIGSKKLLAQYVLDQEEAVSEDYLKITVFVKMM